MGIFPFKKKRVGVALGSGGTKGVAHIAVMEYLDELGVPVHMIAGSSIGSIIGSLYCTGTMKKFKEDVLSMSRRDYFSLFDPLFPRSGLMGGKGFINFLSKYFPADCRIEDFKIPLYIAATDFYNGKTVVFSQGRLMDAIRASISIPGIFTPVRYRKTFLIDGSVANPLPLNVLDKNGATHTIAVNLHPTLPNLPVSYQISEHLKRWELTVSAEDLHPSEPAVPLDDLSYGPASLGKKAEEKLFGLDEKREADRDPNIFEVISKSIDIQGYSNTMLMLKYYRPSVLIEPELPEISSLDFTNFNELLTLGFQACLKQSYAIKRRILSRF